MNKWTFVAILALAGAAAPWVPALAGEGGGMMGGEGHRYGMGYGLVWWWGLYGLVKAGVVVFGLWLLLRIAKAVEKIAASKP